MAGAREKAISTQVDCVLDPDNGNVTLETLQRAAAVVGRRVEVQLV